MASREEKIADVATGSDETVVPIGTAHRSLRDLIADEIRAAIVAGQYKPGERLIEDRLAARFGVSRNPVREAMRVLESEGLVEVTPRRGATVSTISEAEAQEVIELRAALEAMSARLAARRGDPAMKARIAEVLERGTAAVRAADTEALVRMNTEFHALLAQAGANRFLADFMRSLRDRTHWLFAPTMVSRAAESWQEHAAILRAVEAGDEELAALLASRHVTNVGESMAIKACGPGEEPDTSDTAAARPTTAS